jgi:hypothetical protein
MTKSGTIMVLLGMSLAVGSLSGEAFAVSSRTNTAARADVRQLLGLMDKDKNGVVSRHDSSWERRSIGLTSTAAPA